MEQQIAAVVQGIIEQSGDPRDVAAELTALLYSEFGYRRLLQVIRARVAETIDDRNEILARHYFESRYHRFGALEQWPTPELLMVAALTTSIRANVRLILANRRLYAPWPAEQEGA